MTIIRVKVQPGASKNEIAGKWLDPAPTSRLCRDAHRDWVKIKVTAPPCAGKANNACIELLAKELGVPKSRIRLIRGYTSRGKMIQIDGLSKAELYGKLEKFFVSKSLPPKSLSPNLQL